MALRPNVDLARAARTHRQRNEQSWSIFWSAPTFLLVAGYADDAIRLSQPQWNQPDRNGSYSADEAQKDAYAALVNMHASRVQLEIEKSGIGLSWAEMAAQSAKRLGLRLQAWRAERRAASLFADFEVLQSRVRPYAPLDVHIPEWLEPELVAVIGTGIMTEVRSSVGERSVSAQ